MGKEGLMVAKELKRLQTDPIRLERFVKSNVSRLLKSDLVAVLAEFQRQDLVFLSIMVNIRTPQRFNSLYFFYPLSLNIFFFCLSKLNFVSLKCKLLKDCDGQQGMSNILVPKLIGILGV